MTSTTDWQTIEALFDAAWELPAPQRASWLRSSDKPAAIIDEVLRLLAAADASGDFLEHAPAGDAPLLRSGPPVRRAR